MSFLYIIWYWPTTSINKLFITKKTFGYGPLYSVGQGNLPPSVGGPAYLAQRKLHVQETVLNCIPHNLVMCWL